MGSTSKFSCSGTVLVADRDGDADRATALQEGVERAKAKFPGHPVAFGLAFESVEAWTLGAPEAIAQELAVDVVQVRKLYPSGVDVESLSERSGREDHRPKRLLERIAQLKHRHDSTEFRQAVAERTGVADLEQACRQGFAPFAVTLRSAFGPAS